MSQVHILNKKDVRAISKNKPLLFIQGPPVFIRIDAIDEESTSIFVHKIEDLKEDETSFEEAKGDTVSETEHLTDRQAQAEPSNSQDDKLESPVNSSVAKTIAYLEGAFQKEVYRPLEFRTDQEVYKGIIDQVEGEKLHIKQEDGKVSLVEIRGIKEIYWRGKPFNEAD